MPAGRPSKYPKTAAEVEALCERVIECGAEGMSLTEIACEIGVDRRTMDGWAKRHPEFSAALSRACDLAQGWWERAARNGSVGNQPGQINPATWKHVMSCRYRHDYGDRQVIEHQGEGLKIVIAKPGAEEEIVGGNPDS